ncbi:GNAT family N-acetyltransferase [Maliponia aquimaris]|uniref:Ribosomal-protein-L7/L12-serine acetyltransferase n=1 Tax=Maliponia aquimaris TaxID=1673631 RepID=A0A238KX25_9RHOB|nr:GNAT family protein [Maliponia aquimaris]SMX47180.1 ribosomal-protein-L7/L12-serine acetyltransferase [Maliponia aquimaris]
MTETNALGQPVGLPVTGVFPRPRPPHATLQGRHGRLEPLREHHAEGLFAAFAEDSQGHGWTYLPIAPWQDVDEARRWCRTGQGSADPQFYCIADNAGEPQGFCSLLRIAPEVGSVEVGYIHYAPRLQRTRLATEAMVLLMRLAFDDLGYRRYEWKCDALNAPSRAAAVRLGFTFEGVFRQATITKGRNRDTAWYAILDSEWPALRGAFDTWLAPENFDADSRQRQSLSTLTAAALATV